MVQGRDVNVKDLFDVIGEVRLFDDDSTASINHEIQNVHEEPVSLEWMLVSDLREFCEHPLVWFVEPILQSLGTKSGSVSGDGLDVPAYTIPLI